MPPTRSRSRTRRPLIIFLALMGLAALPVGLSSLLQPAARAAATFNVNSTGDGADSNTADNICNDGAGNCTLRAAIQQANATAGADAVNISVTGTINLTGALPDIATDMTITGPGAGNLAVRRDTGGDYRIFSVTAGVVQISGMTVANGRTTDGDSGDIGSAGADGGGLRNSGTLTLLDVTLSGNRTGSGGAGVSFGGSGGRGGGVYNTGTLTMTDCAVSSNVTGAGGNGGANGPGRGGDGGGIYNAGGGFSNPGTLTMTNCTVSDNRTGSAGDSPSFGSTGGRGGGIYSEAGAVVLSGLRVVGNATGAGRATSSGARGSGGQGGGIYLGPGGSARLTNSTVGDNATGDTEQFAGAGGGIDNESTLDVLNSTISGNTGEAGSAVINRRTLTMTNTTVSGNRPHNRGSGVGVSLPTKLTNCTITANEGPGLSAEGTVVGNTIIAGNNSIIANMNDAIFGDVRGLVNSQGHNLVGIGIPDFSVGFSPGSLSDQVGTRDHPIDPRLGPLAGNGGPTLTHALLPGSPALDAGNNALALDASNAPLTTDQRGAGFPRVADSADPNTVQTVDIGAFEAHPDVENVADKTTGEDTPLSFDFNVGDATLGISSVTATSNNQTLVPDAGLIISGAGSTRTLQITPAADQRGTATITLTVNGSNGRSVSDTFLLTVVTGGTLQFSATGFEADEGAGTATVRVTRTGGSLGAASVNFATSGGTATAGASCGSGADYVASAGTLSWADGDTADKTISITLCDDSSPGPDVTFGVSLSGAAGSASLGTPSSATVTIRDDEPLGGRIEFSQTVYTSGENSFVTVTVRRTGETGLAVGVDYMTDDSSTPSVAVPCASTTGRALHRCDFTQAVGRLSFAAGETEKTFAVLVGDDSYVEGTETAALRLLNPGGGAVLGPVSSATLSITDDVPETSGNPNDDSAKFVRQHYHDFFSREPDADGLAFWTGVIESCGADAQCREVRRINVSGAFFLSIEFQQTGFLVERLYKAAYGDATGTSTLNGPHTLPVPIIRFEEFLPDTQRIGRDVIVNQGNWEAQLEANKVAFTQEFVQRPRFLADYPLSLTPTDFVDRLNGRARGPLNATERQALINELTANNTTAGRASVLRKVAEDPTLEAAEKNRAFVLMQYFGYLRRNPNDAPDSDYTGYDFWLGNLEKAGGNFVQAELVKAFISSTEYRQRFGQ